MNVTPPERWEILAAMYKHGTNVEALCTALPDWGPIKVQHHVKCLRNLALRTNFLEKTSELNSMIQWLSFTENLQTLQGTTNLSIRKGRLPANFCPKDHGLLMSKVMLYLSEEEEHPSPSSPTQPDYREIYRYLSQVLAGEELTQLSQGSAMKVTEMLTKVQKVADKSIHSGKLNHYLYMNSHTQSSTTAKKASNSSKGGTLGAESQDCPLFCEEQSIEEIETIEPDKDDPLHKLKINEAVEKCNKKQKEMASSISKLPGLNPLALTLDQLVKCKQTTIKALEEC